MFYLGVEICAGVLAGLFSPSWLACLAAALGWGLVGGVVLRAMTQAHREFLARLGSPTGRAAVLALARFFAMAFVTSTLLALVPALLVFWLRGLL
ncbi:MAG: hypothetical protein V1797_02220 [Pseudomonadota bacterium]